MSIGRDEDDRACLEMVRAWIEQHHPEWKELPTNPQFIEETRDLVTGLSFAFDAGMKRGEEKRGCCEKHDG